MTEIESCQMSIERLRFQLELASQYILSNIKSNQPDDGFMNRFAVACKEECQKHTPTKVLERWNALMDVEQWAWQYMHDFVIVNGRVDEEIVSLLKDSLEKSRNIIHPKIASS